jgi:hypothetical protein
MDGTNDAERELRELAEGSDIEESALQRGWESAEGDDDEDNKSIVDWQDDEMTVLDREMLNASLKPGRMLMIKASQEQKNDQPTHLSPVALKDLLRGHPFKHDLVANVV